MKAFLALLLALPLAAQVSPPSNQSRAAGRFVAWNYGGWRIQVQTPQIATGSQTFSPVSSTVNLGDGRVIMPFNTNAQIVVGTETVTLTAVGSGCIIGALPGACVLTATFSSKHTNADQISSATFGLQEALNDAGSSGGGAVAIDSAWANAGGTTGIKNAAILPANTAIEDVRTGSTSGLPAGCTSSGTGILTCTGAVTGNPLLSGPPTASAQAALPTGAHGLACDESATAGVPAVGVDYLRCDSVTHKLVLSQNNNAEAPLAQASSAWTVTTPTVTCFGGTPTNVTAAFSTGTDSGKTRFLSVTVTVTDKGTCSDPGGYTMNMPFTAQTGAILSCRENVTSGATGFGLINASQNTLYMQPYVNPSAPPQPTWAVNTDVIVCSGVVQSQ